MRVWIARRLYLAGARVDPYRIATMAEAAAAIDKFIEDQRAVSDSAGGEGRRKRDPGINSGSAP